MSDPHLLHFLQQIIEFLGTFAFAISGIRHAAAKNFDLFGGYVCGFAVAIGGGTIRDLMLGATPFDDKYDVCSLYCCGITFCHLVWSSYATVRQCLVCIRYFGFGFVYNSWITKNDSFWISFLGGYYYGLHNWSSRRSYT